MNIHHVQFLYIKSRFKKDLKLQIHLSTYNYAKSFDKKIIVDA